MNNYNQETIDNAIKKYRPLLKALDIQHINKTLRYIETRTVKSLYFSRCIIVTKQKKMKGNHLGFCSFSYNEKNRIYILTIALNENLFIDENIDTRIKRKLTGVHEFTHCVATLMALSRFSEDSKFKKDLNEALQNSLSHIDIDKSIFEVCRNFDSDDEYTRKEGPLKNSHFQLKEGYDAFDGDYVDLFFNFLFSYELFLETFQSSLEQWAYEKDEEIKKEILESILDIFNSFIVNKALEKDFAKEQFRDFLRRFFIENPISSYIRAAK